MSQIPRPFSPPPQRPMLLKLRTRSAAILQVAAQIHAGTPVAAKPEADGTWTIAIEGMHTIQRVVSDEDIV